MIRLRLLLVWLLMAAIPMQGFAAASMLFCGVGGERTQVQAVAETHAHPESRHVHAAAQHDHSSHDYGMSDSHGSSATDAKNGAHDAGHKCSICAACCNSVAIIGINLVITAAPAPQAKLAEPFVLILARATPVPDKPPRA